MRRALTLAVVASLAFAANAFAGGSASSMDSNKDGKVSRSEFDQYKSQIFSRVDVDKNGQLDSSEQQQLASISQDDSSRARFGDQSSSSTGSGSSVSGSSSSGSSSLDDSQSSRSSSTSPDSQ